MRILWEASTSSILVFAMIAHIARPITVGFIAVDDADATATATPPLFGDECLKFGDGGGTANVGEIL